MPRKTRVVFVCQQCGGQSPRWAGRCAECGAWNSLVETVESEPTPRQRLGALPRSQPVALPKLATGKFERVVVPNAEFNRVLGGGIVPGSVVLVGGDPGIGKCVSGDTRVLDPQTGAYLPITELARGERAVLAVDERNLRLEPALVDRFHERGVKPVVEVRTELGRVLHCTPDHPVLTPEGWRPVGHLAPGAYVASPRALPCFGREALPEAEVKLIAYILSDGSAQSAICVPIGDLAPAARDRADMRTPVARLLEGHGLRHVRAADKRVPDCVFLLPREQLALFLRVLFTCDGSVYVNGHGQPGVSYGTISRRLAEDVQHLLLRFGLVAKLRTKHSQVRGRPYTSYEVVLLGVPVVQQFLSTIGIAGREAACQRITAMVASHSAPTRRDTVPTGEPFWRELRAVLGGTGFRELSRRAGVKVLDRRHDGTLCRSTVERLGAALGDERLMALARGDVYWDRIVSVESAGEAPVYDLTVPGRANFVANDLIVHNSTLLLQISSAVADGVGSVLYVSGEESAEQIRLRAERLGIEGERLFVLSETCLDQVLGHVEQLAPALVVVDSIQTMYLESVPSAAGSISQVRESAMALLRMAKATHVPVFLVGHVTKEGAIAGPRVLEHIVDTVLYLEGERFHTYRLLRSVKNRFGSTNEIGVFEMQEAGMVEVANPSAIFLAERLETPIGSAVAVTLEGTRPILVEVQALTTTTSFGLPRRTGNGVDFNRLLLLTAVLSKQVGLALSNQDIYVNVVGGLKVSEPAVDLAVALAIASSFKEVPIGHDLAAIGEIGLSGELRRVGQVERRLAEAGKLGFRRCLLPRSIGDDRRLAQSSGLELIGAQTLSGALEAALSGA